MPLFERLSAGSTAEDIANAYEEFIGLAGGDTTANQQLAISYLDSLGIGTPTIQSAYNIYTAPDVVAPVVTSPLSSVTSAGGGGVLEDTSTYTTPVNTYVAPTTTTGALAQATAEDAFLDSQAQAQADQIAANNAANSTIQLAGQNISVSNAAVDKVTQQILAQGTTSKWTGEGFGSAEANARSMAQQLVANNITDINQVGKVDKKVDVAVTPQYEYTNTGQVDQDGVPITTATLVGYVDQNGKAVDAALVKAEQIYDGGDSGTSTTSYVAPIGTVSVIGNKATGKELINDYGERGGVGDAWSGTYAGKGNTAFRTTFDASGKPIFYTTGASSSDVGDYAPILALAQFIPGLAPFAMAANAAIAIDNGDVLGGLASMAGLGGYTDIATGLRVAKAIDQKDLGALASSLLQNDTIGSMAGSTMLTDTISLADAGNAYNTVVNIQNQNYAGALNSLGTLTGSADTKTAGAALNLVNALNSGNEVSIINAAAGLNNTINAANNLSNAAVAKSVTSNVTNGAGAFVAAKEAGATDAEALSAANTVTGIGTDTGTGTSVSTTKSTQVTDSRAQNTLDLSNTEAATLDEAAYVAKEGGHDSFRVGDKLYIINTATGNLPADEQQAADSRLVKSYVNSLGKTDVSQLTKDEQTKFLNSYNSYTANGTGVLKSATLADVLSGNSTYSAAESLENSKYTTPFKIDISGVGNRGDATDTVTGTPTTAQNLDVAGNNLVNWANTLEGTSGDVVRQTLSTLIGAGGEQVADLGTALANMGVAERYNLLVQLGQSLERTGGSLEIPGVTQATENFFNDIQGAETYAGKAAAAIKSVINNPLVLTQVAKEGLQEVLPIVTGGAVFKILGKGAGIATDVLMNASESMGSQSRQKFNEEIAKGTPVDQAERLANADGWKAFTITAGTAGLADASLIKGYEKAMEKFFGKTTTSVGKEWAEEGFEELAVALATGDDLATSMTKSIAGSTVGSKTSGSLTAGSSISADIQQAFASEGLTSTDGSFRPETITKITDTGTAGATGTTGTAGTTVTEVAGSGTTASGANTAATVGTATAGADTAAATDFASIFTSTGNTTQAVDTSVGSAISNGADVNSTIASVVNAANVTGANANVVAATATNAAVAAGADVATASNAATSAVSNVTAGTGATTAGTGTTTAGTGTTTAGTGATTAGTGTTTAGTGATTAGTGTTTAGTGATTAGTGATTAGTGTAATTGTGVTTGTATGANTTTTGTTTGANTGTTTSTNAATGATTSTNAATGVTSSTTSDANTGTTTTTTSNATTGTTTAVSTDNTTGVTTTTNNNATTGVGTTSTNNTTTGVTTNTVVGANTDLTTTLNVNTDTGEIISVDGPGKVIDSNTVVVDGTAIDVTTGEVLTPEEVEKRKEAAKLKLATPKKQTPGAMAGLAFNEPTYKAKDSDIAETWLGGRFRNLAPLAGLGALLPQDTPMFQEAQAISALRRASGIEDGAEKPEADYYAYGTEPSYSKVLEPFMNGGTVQKYADGGKIMASPLMAASGGDVPHKGSHYVQGAGGGQDDLISAKLADGEYVFDADIVAALGDGSNKEGAKRLDAMREAIRKHKRGGSIKSIPPAAKSPLAYLKGAL